MLGLLLLGADVVDDAGDHDRHGEGVDRRAGLLELVEQHPQLDRVALAEAGHGPLDQALVGERPVERGAVERARCGAGDR